MISTRNGGDDSSRLVVDTKSVTGVKAYSVVSGKISAYNNSAKLEGYINGSWETITTLTSGGSATDKGGNGGQAVQYHYGSGIISKAYTQYRLTATGSSVHPDFAVAVLFG